MARKYTNPPILEALCEFQFVPSQPWDMTIPGLLYEKISHEFPLKEQKTVFGTAFTPKEGGVQQRVEMSTLIQFLRSDRTVIIQVGPDLLTVNQLRPYPTWEHFKPLITSNLQTYQGIAKPKGFKRIGLRYINRIDIPGGPIEVTDYFNYYAPIPASLPQTHDSFEVKVVIPYNDGRDYLLLKLASVSSEKPDAVSILLDLDYILAKPEAISLEQADSWIENAHSAVESAFEACITERSRELFKEQR